MPNYILNVEGYKPVSGVLELEAPPAPQYWRVPHDIERINWNAGDMRYGGDGYRLGPVRGSAPTPEVYRVYPDQTTPIGEAHQWLWRNLNPLLSDDKWSRLLGNAYAFTNNTGFPGRHDYVNNRDVDKELPRFHAALVCGGAILEGQELNGKVWIKSILISDPVPMAADVLADPGLWFYGTNVGADGYISFMQKKGMDDFYHTIVVPLLTKVPVYLPTNELHKLPAGFFPPDARWLA